MEDTVDIRRHDPWSQVGLYCQQSHCEPNTLQNYFFSSEVISCLSQCRRECCMVAKGTDRMEVLPPETVEEQFGPLRTEALMERPSVAADSRTRLCSNTDWRLVLNSHRNLKAQLKGSRCSWELQQLQLSTGRPMKTEWWAILTGSLGCGTIWYPNKPAE